jgi:hypothetical protein
VRADYVNLKTAAVAMARAPEVEQRNVIAAYSWAYCEMAVADGPRASGMYLLLRVLFVLPTRYTGSDAATFGSWPRPAAGPGEWDLSWPVHIEPGTHALHVEPFPSGQRWCDTRPYPALLEYDYFAARFPRRSPAEIEALEIR